MTVTQLDIPSDHPAFSGHFPSHPIVPGVVLLDQAKQRIEAECGLLTSGLQVAKFLSPALPGDSLALQYRIAGKHIQFEIRCGLRLIASGKFLTPDASNGHGKDDTPEDKTRHARFPHPNPLPEGEGTNGSLREFHVNT